MWSLVPNIPGSLHCFWSFVQLGFVVLRPTKFQVELVAVSPAQESSLKCSHGKSDLHK